MNTKPNPSFLEGIPIPLSGLMLGSAALGNLLLPISEGLRWTFGVISFLLFLLLIGKIIAHPKKIKEELENPAIAGVAATFPMGLMLLTVYMRTFIGDISTVIWYIAIILHAGLILFFSGKFLFKLEWKKVFTSYFIVYVGIVSASITANVHNQLQMGQIAFWFGCIVLFPLLAIVGYRYVKYKEMPEPVKPLFVIFAAPTSLTLVGYLQIIEAPNRSFTIFLFVLATALYILVITRMPKLLKLPFFPSYSAFTFPLVISAMATRMALTSLGWNQGIGGLWISLQILLASASVAYVFIHYIIFLGSSKWSQ